MHWLIVDTLDVNRLTASICETNTFDLTYRGTNIMQGLLCHILRIEYVAGDVRDCEEICMDSHTRN